MSSSSSEPASATRVLVERRPELLLAEVRPQRVREHELRVRRLPEEEVREPLLPGRPDDEIRVGELGSVESRGQRLLGDVLRSDSVCDEPRGGLDELGATAVVEGDPEQEPVVVRRLLLEHRHLLAEALGNPVAAADEARADAPLREIRALAVALL